MRISTNIPGWLILAGWAWLSFRMWQIGIRPRATDPKTTGRRSLHIVGAIIFTVMTIYFLGVGFGLYHI